MASNSRLDQFHKGISFFKSWQNTLLFGSSLTYLGWKVIFPLTGKSADAYSYLARINTKLNRFWIAQDFNDVYSFLYSVHRDIRAYRDPRTNKEVREGKKDGEGKWVYFPNEEMVRSARSREFWLFRRLVGTVLKTFSSYFFTYEGLKAAGVFKSDPSVSIKVLAGIARIACLGQELYDLSVRHNDYDAHNLYNSLKKVGENRENPNKDYFDNAYRMNLQCTGAMKGLIIGIESMAILSTLFEAKFGGLMGRVTNSALMSRFGKHSEHLFNPVFILMTITSIIQHYYVNEYLEKWKETEKSSPQKYLFKDIADSGLLFRLIEGTARTLINFGVDVLAQTHLESLSELVKEFNSYLCVPAFFKKVDDFCKGTLAFSQGKLNKANQNLRAKNEKELSKQRAVWNATRSAFKMISGTAAALQFVGGFTGVAHISSRSRSKWLGYVKNGFSGTAAAMTIAEEVIKPKKEWKGKKCSEIYLASLSIIESSASFMLNLGGGLPSAFGHLVTSPKIDKLPDSYYNILSLIRTIAEIFKEVINRSELHDVNTFCA